MLLKFIIVTNFALFLNNGVSAVGMEKHNSFINMTEYPGELCNRKCLKNDQRVCYFKFVLEHYQAMGAACGKCAKGVMSDCFNPQCIIADGVEKGVTSFNRMIPGPSVQTCKDDMIIIDVVNNAQGIAASIHWHGLYMRKTPYMDGVPYVTQCPISFSTTFRYWFWASESGTLFYHSHSGHQKINGQYGAMIVREPEETTSHINEYDFDLPDHYILISDWVHGYGENYFPGLPSSLTVPKSLLVNGRGTYIKPITMEYTKVPVTTFIIKPGKRYRFRVINSISMTCPAQLQIQSHSFKLITTDSFGIEPFPLDTLVTNAGERYDFVLTANHTEGDFWIRVRGVGVCALSPMESFALLRYETPGSLEGPQPPFPLYTQMFPNGRILNSGACSVKNNEYCVTDLTALERDDELLYKKPDQQLFLNFKNILVPNTELFGSGKYDHFANPFSNATFVGAINDISSVFPSSPVLTQYSDVDESQFCDRDHLPKRCIGQTYCTCIHRIKIKKGSIVEVFIVDGARSIGLMQHPFHIHGYRFLVTELGKNNLGLPLTEGKAKNTGKGVSQKYNRRPPFKDTVSVPSCGYVVVRFRADNPGFWLVHCHYEWHFSSGMGIMLQIGKTKEMVSAPKGFPKCNSYLPKLRGPKYY